MGQIYQAIKPKEVIETFGIKNFVETGTGIATVFRIFSMFAQKI